MDSRHYTNKLLEMIENGLLDKDTVIMACVKYMSESDVQDMMHANEFISPDDEEPDWDQWDSDEYDVEQMQFDYGNGNFSEDDVEDYLCENIIRASVENGQIKQAKAQCVKYGLDWSDYKP